MIFLGAVFILGVSFVKGVIIEEGFKAATEKGIKEQKPNSSFFLYNTTLNLPAFSLEVVDDDIVFSTKTSITISKDVFSYQIPTSPSKSLQYYQKEDLLLFIENDLIFSLEGIICKSNYSIFKVHTPFIKPINMEIDNKHDLIFVSDDSTSELTSSIQCCKMNKLNILECVTGTQRGGRSAFLAADEKNSLLYVYNEKFQRISVFRYELTETLCSFFDFRIVLNDIYFEVTSLLINNNFLLIAGKQKLCFLRLDDKNKSLECSFSDTIIDMKKSKKSSCLSYLEPPLRQRPEKILNILTIVVLLILISIAVVSLILGFFKKKYYSNTRYSNFLITRDE